MLALTAYERRSAIALLRACGAGGWQVSAVFAGAAVVVTVVAAPIAVLLERLVVGPRAATLAASYADISLAAGPGEVAAVLIGLAVIAGVASGWVGRGAMRASVVAGLRRE